MIKSQKNRAAIFLDRDGVINKKPKEHNYVKSWNEFEFLPDSPQAIKLAKDAGFFVIVISNQRGIARGLVNIETIDLIHKNLNITLKQYNTYIDAFYFCPHDTSDNCECRKPRPGLILKAALDFGIDLTHSVFVGDMEVDLEAGIQAGVKTIIMPTNGSLLDVLVNYLNGKK